MTRAAARIIGVGNAFLEGDAMGPAVCAHLNAGKLPAGVEVIDGGLGGLDLMPLLEGVDRVVFVDAGRGFDPSEGPLITLSAEEAALHAPMHYGHGAGLMYLLRALPHMSPPCDAEVSVLCATAPPSPEAVRETADEALGLATRRAAPQ